MDKTKILVVDDEKHILQKYADILQELDITLESSPLQAIELMRNITFNIIIADYIMPTVNGIEFLEVVKDEYKNKRYVSIFCTAHGTTYLFEDAQETGLFQFYLEKPFTTESIQKVMAQAFDLLKKECVNDK